MLEEFFTTSEDDNLLCRWRISHKFRAAWCRVWATQNVPLATSTLTASPVEVPNDPGSLDSINKMFDY